MKCFITRWLISQSFDTNNAIPHSAKRHMAKCVQCQQWYEVQGKINKSFTAQNEDAASSPFLEKKIINAISSMTSETAVKSSQTKFVPALASIAISIIIVCFVIFLKMKQNNNERHHHKQLPIKANTVATSYSPDIDRLFQTIIADILPPGAKEIIPHPYQKEMNLLLNDLQKAANFAVACLPINI